MSATFSATVYSTSNLFSGPFFAVLFADCEEYFCILVGFLPSARHANRLHCFRLSKVGSLIEWKEIKFHFRTSVGIASGTSRESCTQIACLYGIDFTEMLFIGNASTRISYNGL